MSDDRNTAEFDFRKPCALAAEVRTRLEEWQHSTCRLTNDRWAHLLAKPVTWSEAPVETNRPDRITSPTPVIAFEIDLANDQGMSLLLLPRPLALMIVLALLGAEIDPSLEDKELTSLEVTLLRMVLEQFIEGCNETQPTTPVCALGRYEPKPDLQRIFRDNVDLVVMNFRLEGPFPPQTISWLWREPLATALFSSNMTTAQSVESARSLRELARDVPFELVIRLGSLKLRISELSNLAEGDVILLDQRVNDTLQAYLGQLPCYAGWAGRVGNRQGFQVAKALT